MSILLINAHPEPKSFCGSLFTAAVETLKAEGHEIRTSDLYPISFNPVSIRCNFTGAKDPLCFKQQIEEMHAIESTIGNLPAEHEDYL